MQYYLVPKRWVYMFSAKCAQLLVIGLLVVTTGPTPPTMNGLDAAWLDGRLTIKTGRFAVVDHHRREFLDKSRPSRGSTMDIVTYIDGSCWREDVTENGATSRAAVSNTHFYRYDSLPRTVGPPQAGLVMKALTAINQADPEYMHFQPLRLMSAPTWYITERQLPTDYLIGSPARRDVHVESVRWRGKQAWKVRCIWTAAGEWDTSWIIVPSWGYSIVRFDCTCIKGNLQVGDNVCSECTVAEVAPGIWFPRHVEYRQNDHLGTVTEDLQIEATDVNHPMDAAIFTPVRMSIPVGTEVAQVPRMTKFARSEWNGTTIETMSGIERIRLGIEEPRAMAKIIRLMVLGATIATALAGIALLRRNGRKDGRPPSDAAI